ncbi:MAG: extracellular solute-binding protein [Thermomicrobiales bacterium]
MTRIDRACSRRRFLGAGAGMAAALTLGTRGASLASPAERSAILKALAQGEITLDVFVHANHPFDRVKPIYEQTYPNVTLNMMENNDMAVFRATLAAEGEGTPDIFWPEIDAVQELGKTGVLLDVTDLVKKHEQELAAGKTAECLIPSTGTYAAFPGDIATVGLYYRQDVLDEADVTIPNDWTWDDWITAATEIKDKTGKASLSLSTTGDAVTPHLWQFILFQLGGAVTNADGTEVTLDDEKGIAAMELTKKVYEADVHIDENPFEENFFAEISAGNVGMVPAAVWYRGFGIEPYVTDESNGLGQWRVALLPRPAEGAARVANLGGAAIASTTYTEHPQEVMNFMELALGSLEGATACGDWGILPPFLPYLQSDAWNNVRSEAFGDFAFNEVWTQAVDQYPGTWYKQPVFGEAMTTLGAAMMPMLNGDVDIPTGMKDAGDQVRELNKRYQ